MAPISRRMGRLIRFISLAVLAFSLAFILFVVSLVINRNQPLELPAPTGPDPVGRVEYNWVDASRPDPLADSGANSRARKLVIWVWYPAAQAGDPPAPYLPPAWAQVRDRDQGPGVLVESNLSRIRTHAFAGVPPAAAPPTFPVLVMEPGMGPMTTDYTIFAENLASHGYIVVGIHPTGSSNWTVFLDGQAAPRSPRGTIPDSDTPDQAEADGSRILAVWAQDEEFVLDQLARMNADPASPFQNRLDLQRVGIWGHSFGGATALAVCQKDSRCKAGVDIDGTPFGEERQLPVSVPFMIMTEDYTKGCDSNCQLIRQVYQNTRDGGAISVSVAGAGHFNFSDLPLRQQPVFRPLFALAGYEGSIAPERGLQIANVYLLAFFDQYLKGMQAAVLQGPSPAYPEVTFERH